MPKNCGVLPCTIRLVLAFVFCLLTVLAVFLAIGLESEMFGMAKLAPEWVVLLTIAAAAFPIPSIAFLSPKLPFACVRLPDIFFRMGKPETNLVSIQTVMEASSQLQTRSCHLFHFPFTS